MSAEVQSLPLPIEISGCSTAISQTERSRLYGLFHDIRQPVESLQLILSVLKRRMPDSGDCGIGVHAAYLYQLVHLSDSCREGSDIMIPALLSDNTGGSLAEYLYRMKHEIYDASGSGTPDMPEIPVKIGEKGLMIVLEEIRRTAMQLPDLHQLSGVINQEELLDIYDTVRQLLNETVSASLVFADPDYLPSYRHEHVPVFIREIIGSRIMIGNDKLSGISVSYPRPQVLALSYLPVETTVIRTAMNNILSNAIKYSPASSPIRIHLRLNRDGNLEIGVRDYGIGMTIREIRRVMDRTESFRTEASQKTAPGSGNGIMFCMEILEKVGGSIIISSPGRGKGTLVKVTLPVPRPEQIRRIGQDDYFGTYCVSSPVFPTVFGIQTA